MYPLITIVSNYEKYIPRSDRKNEQKRHRALLFWSIS